jgi:hypothetical protein
MEKNCYNIIGQSYFESQQVNPDPRCNGWTAVNKGATLCIVNGIELKPFPPGHPELSGESFGVTGNLGEVFTGRITLDITPGAGAKLLLIQKFYT